MNISHAACRTEAANQNAPFIATQPQHRVNFTKKFAPHQAMQASSQRNRALSCHAGWIRTHVPVDAPLGTAPLAKLPSLRPTSTCTHSTTNQSTDSDGKKPFSATTPRHRKHNQIGSNLGALSPRSISPRTSTVGLPRLSKIWRAFTDWIVAIAERTWGRTSGLDRAAAAAEKAMRDSNRAAWMGSLRRRPHKFIGVWCDAELGAGCGPGFPRAHRMEGWGDVPSHCKWDQQIGACTTAHMEASRAVTWRVGKLWA